MRRRGARAPRPPCRVTRERFTAGPTGRFGPPLAKRRSGPDPPRNHFQPVPFTPRPFYAPLRFCPEDETGPSRKWKRPAHASRLRRQSAPNPQPPLTYSFGPPLAKRRSGPDPRPLRRASSPVFSAPRRLRARSKVRARPPSHPWAQTPSPNGLPRHFQPVPCTNPYRALGLSKIAIK